MIAIIAGVGILSTTGFTAFSAALAQTTIDNATMTGNMTGGNTTIGEDTNQTGSVSGRGRK